MNYSYLQLYAEIITYLKCQKMNIFTHSEMILEIDLFIIVSLSPKYIHLFDKLEDYHLCCNHNLLFLVCC